LAFYALYIIIRMLFIPKNQRMQPATPDISEEIETPEVPVSPIEEKEIPSLQQDTPRADSTFFSAPIIETHPTDQALNLTDPTPKDTKGE
jgi:hypothetical protein